MIQIFDTTLRDGEQSPGVSLTPEEKLNIAHQLAALNVDVIEAGFPITSEGDFKSVQDIARRVEGPVITGLARVKPEDIDSAYQAVRDAERPRIHVFISTSDIHIDSQLGSSREAVLQEARAGVAKAAGFGVEVEFSPMDATRSNQDFMFEVCQAAINEGATIINLPDTVGYATPEEYGEMFRDARKQLLGNFILSAHTHNDLGLAVINSIAAIQNGAKQIECSVNGIGERAGNCSLEELCMALATRSDVLRAETGLNLPEIARTSRMVSRYTGYPIPPNKPIVGRNAFSHESGIHQDGVLKDRSTYEIMNPEDIGVENDQIVLGKHSGRHAFKQVLEDLGYTLEEDKLNSCFIQFKQIADRKKHITLLDIEALVADQTNRITQIAEINHFEVTVSSSGEPFAEVVIRRGDERLHASSTGDGAMDALFQAIEKALGLEDRVRLTRYSVQAVTEGEDSLAEVLVGLEIDGQTKNGQAVDPDTVAASGEAYLRACL